MQLILDLHQIILYVSERISQKKIYKLIITIDSKIRDKKLQYNIKREAAKVSASLSGKIDKYEYLTGEELLASDQSRMIKQTKFTYSNLEKALEK